MPLEEQNPTNPESKDIQENTENPAVDEFFHRLPSNFRRPKPSDEAIAAAMEAVQRVAAGIAGTDESVGQDACSGCGVQIEAGTQFCPQCGLATGSSTREIPPVPKARSGSVHYHHHFHHFVPRESSVPSSNPADADSTSPRGRVPGSTGTAPGGRAEFNARQVAQNWAQACNTRHLDDLVELYVADATLVRSNVPPMRSLPAVREFLHSVLEAGLGELEMESLRLEVMGDIAMDLGRCKMLVPVAMGKRREERGKYLLVLVKQPAGTWKILADCWSSDQTVTPTPPPEPARKVPEPGVPVRKPR